MKKVLLVDDDVEFCEATKLLLESKGYEVLLAYDGKQGLEQVRAGRPDLVILDVMMPGMSGLEVCRRMRNDPNLADLPVIYVTDGQEYTRSVRVITTQAVGVVPRVIGYGYVEPGQVWYPAQVVPSPHVADPKQVSNPGQVLVLGQVAVPSQVVKPSQVLDPGQVAPPSQVAKAGQVTSPPQVGSWSQVS